jgi:hypothetical protein
MSGKDSGAALAFDSDGRRNPSRPSRYADVNAVVGGHLRDLAFAQSSQQKMFGYKRAAAAILALEAPLTDLVEPDGALPRISGIGPGSTRRITGSRAGVVAQWNAVFAAAAERGVAIELDGDPARQDLDDSLAAEALGARCLFALDSDAHTTGQLAYAETAIAQARLAGIPPDRIVNCWPVDRLLVWLSDPLRERLVPATS